MQEMITKGGNDARNDYKGCQWCKKWLLMVTMIQEIIIKNVNDARNDY